MADIPASGVALLKRLENCELKAYPDDKGIWTQGFGHTEGITSDSPDIDQGQADAWLAEDCAWAWAAIEQLVKVSLSDNQAGALLSFVYNLGQPQFKKSTLLAQLNDGCYTCVPGQMVKWIWETKPDGSRAVSDGLENRRRAESQLWMQQDVTA